MLSCLGVWFSGCFGAVAAAVLSWLTFGEAFSTGGTACPSTYAKEGGRCPVLEWEEQGGFGWGWSYMCQLFSTSNSTALTTGNGSSVERRNYSLQVVGWNRYRRDWAMKRISSGGLFASENRGEESGVIKSWKQVVESTGDQLPKDADGRLVIRGVFFHHLFGFLQLIWRRLSLQMLE